MKRIKRKNNSNKVFSRGSQIPGYIVSETVDFWMTGGLSVLTMLGLLLLAFTTGEPSRNALGAIGGMIVFQALINWPHFIGAYGLLYRSTSQIKKYQTATIWVPVVLVLILFGATSVGDLKNGVVFKVNYDIAYLIWIIAAFYLAWHYAGQAWGLIASFSFLSETEYRGRERQLIRWGVKTLIIWHVIWGAEDLPVSWLMGLHGALSVAQNLVNVVCIVNFLIGSFIWWSIYQRQHRLDRRILAVWLSIYLWYLVLYFSPDAYPFIQLSHALQYLIFPLRVEMNKRHFQNKTNLSSKQNLWIIGYGVILVSVGLIIFWVPNYFSDPAQIITFSAFIASLVAIHHYFVDSCIWKISNPDVRNKLFAHLNRKK